MMTAMEPIACPDLAVPAEIMQHIVDIESSRNPFAIGVVGGQLARQPRSLPEAIETVRMLDSKGYGYSLGLTQISRANLARVGLDTHEKAFGYCPNIVAGSRILADCHIRAGGDWGKAFSCYYSGNFSRGYRDGYVQKVFRSMAGRAAASSVAPPRQSQNTTRRRHTEEVPGPMQGDGPGREDVSVDTAFVF